MKIFIYSFFLISFFPVLAIAEDRVPPVLVELFTAENCPACPPADEYIGKLANAEHVMALACHVDYFGRGSIGLGKKACTKRQEMYRQQLGKKKYFTPQMMINGKREEIGYQSDKVAAEIAKSRADQTSHIAIHQKASGVYDYMLPRVNYFQTPVELWIATYAKPLQSNQRGVQKKYYNVVQRIMPLGLWRGEARQRAFFPITNAQTAGFVIVAQDSRSGAILGLGEYQL